MGSNCNTNVSKLCWDYARFWWGPQWNKYVQPLPLYPKISSPCSHYSRDLRDWFHSGGGFPRRNHARLYQLSTSRKMWLPQRSTRHNEELTEWISTASFPNRWPGYSTVILNSKASINAHCIYSCLNISFVFNFFFLIISNYLLQF